MTLLDDKLVKDAEACVRNFAGHESEPVIRRLLDAYKASVKPQEPVGLDEWWATYLPSGDEYAVASDAWAAARAYADPVQAVPDDRDPLASKCHDTARAYDDRQAKFGPTMQEVEEFFADHTGNQNDHTPCD